MRAAERLPAGTGARAAERLPAFAVLRGAAALARAVDPLRDAALLEREDEAAREPPEEVRRALAEAPCFVFLGAITSESYGQASDVILARIVAHRQE